MWDSSSIQSATTNFAVFIYTGTFRFWSFFLLRKCICWFVGVWVWKTKQKVALNYIVYKYSKVRHWSALGYYTVVCYFQVQNAYTKIFYEHQIILTTDIHIKKNLKVLNRNNPIKINL